MKKLKKILLLPSTFSSGAVGPVVKAINIAQLLQQSGWQVHFAIGGTVARLISEHGFSVSSCPVPQAEKNIGPITNMIEAMEWNGVTNPDYIQEIVKEEINIVSSFRPDVIFAEARPTAAITAAITKVPLVTIANWPQHPDFPANRRGGEQSLQTYNRLLSKYHLPEIENVTELIFLHSDLKITPSIPELEPELVEKLDTHFVGYIFNKSDEKAQLPPWFESWKKDPLIFIYFSVSALSPQLYIKTILETFQELDVRVLCAYGFHYLLDSAPENTDKIRFARFFPAQAIMKHADLVLFHGGQNTALMTSYYGLPSITIPGQHYERQYNASQLARLGTSKTLPVYAFRPHRLQQTVMEMLNDQYRLAGQRLAQRLSTFGGAEQVAHMIETLV